MKSLNFDCKSLRRRVFADVIDAQAERMAQLRDRMERMQAELNDLRTEMGQVLGQE
jgi:hypothetical protein